MEQPATFASLSPETLRFKAVESYIDYVNMVWFATKEPETFILLEPWVDITGNPEEPDRLKEFARIIESELRSDLHTVIKSTMYLEGMVKFPSTHSPELKRLHQAVNYLLQEIDPNEFIDFDGRPMWEPETGLPNPLKYKHNLTRIMRPRRDTRIPLKELLGMETLHPLIRQKLPD